MISLDRTNFLPPKPSISLETSNVIWSYVLEKVTRQGGPFAGHAKTDQFESLVKTAVRLFPAGIPDRHCKWERPEEVLPSEYAPFLKKVFTRTVPTPISDRGLSSIKGYGKPDP